MTRWLVPLVCYYGIAIAVPVANGAAVDRPFIEHCLFVLAVPLLLLMVVAGVKTSLRRVLSGVRHARPTHL